MKKKMCFFSLWAVAALFVLSVTQCNAQNLVRIRFDSNKEVSGQKFAIKDISPGLPTNWDTYNFVVLEFKSTTPQRFQVGFTTETGYNELRVMSYTANGWSKLAIPLKFFMELPGAALFLTYSVSIVTICIRKKNLWIRYLPEPDCR